MDLTLEEWIYLAIAIIGVCIALWWNFRYSIQMLISGTEAEGTIINWMQGIQKGKRLFYPLIEFYTESGVKQVFRADEHSENEPKYPVGTLVKIRYAKSNPENRKVIYP